MKLRYDRGTIVLEAEAFPAELNTSTPWEWDARLECWRTLSRQYVNEIKRFVKQQIEFQDDVVLPEWHHPAQWTLKNARTYQSLALSLWNLNERRGIVCLPTGAGKSHLALTAMAASQCATLCLVPTRILLHQWKQTLSESYSGKIGVLGDGHHTLAPITVATFESAYRNAAQIGQHFKLLIVDEAHHFGKGVRDEILDTCVAPYRLGLTATLPESEIEKQNLCARIGKVVYQLDLKDLTGTYLADYKHFLLRVALTFEERKLYELHRTVFENFRAATQGFLPPNDWPLFVREALKSNEGRRALECLKVAKTIARLNEAKIKTVKTLLKNHAEKQTLIFTADACSAYTLSENLFIPALTSEITKKERENILNKFRQGIYPALISCRVLNEGFDFPKASVAIILGGSQGEREHVQRIGRVLRKEGEKVALIYEVISSDTAEEWKLKQRTHKRSASNQFG